MVQTPARVRREGAASGRFYRDARIFEIFQGTSEINRVIIAGQLGL